MLWVSAPAHEAAPRSRKATRTPDIERIIVISRTRESGERRVTSRHHAGTGNRNVLLQTAESAQDAETVPQTTRRSSARSTLRPPKPARRQLSGNEGEGRKVDGHSGSGRWPGKQKPTAADHAQRLAHPPASRHAYDTRRGLPAPRFRRSAFQCRESTIFSVQHPVPFPRSPH